MAFKTRRQYELEEDKKQALRDAPADSAIESATDEAGLKSQWNTSILGDSPYS